MFERFAQADTSNTRTKGGTGLGLSIVKEIVTRLGGDVEFADAPGGGTIFHVDLPASGDPVTVGQPAGPDKIELTRIAGCVAKLGDEQQPRRKERGCSGHQVRCGLR
jgi:hypothetical protein